MLTTYAKKILIFAVFISILFPRPAASHTTYLINPDDSFISFTPFPCFEGQDCSTQYFPISGSFRLLYEDNVLFNCWGILMRLEGIDIQTSALPRGPFEFPDYFVDPQGSSIGGNGDPCNFWCLPGTCYSRGNFGYYSGTLSPGKITISGTAPFSEQLWDNYIFSIAARAILEPSQTADFNGDGLTDISAFHLPSNQFFSFSSGNHGQYGWENGTCIPVIWDYSGFGKSEISIFHTPTNRWLLNGHPGEVLKEFGIGGPDSIPVPGDYNGDGIIEMAFYHWPTNQWHIEGQDPIPFGWDRANCIPVPGDYDGDGKTDLVLYHVASNQWFMYGVGEMGQFGWGGSDSIPIPADYDGDGAIDIAVYHVPSNQWLIKGYPEGNMGQFGWGGSESFPIPGDYNGDGIAERAFYRPAENKWFIEGEPEFVWGWDGENFMPITSQSAVFNWYRFRLGMFQ